MAQLVLTVALGAWFNAIIGYVYDYIFNYSGTLLSRLLSINVILSQLFLKIIFSSLLFPEAPPSYDSLYGKVKAAKRESGGKVDFFKKFMVIVCGTSKLPLA